MTPANRRFWPYDEVSMVRESSTSPRVLISTPWLTFTVRIDDGSLEKTDALIGKMQSGQLSAEDLDDMSWFFSALSDKPLAYILPRGHEFGIDTHGVIAAETNDSTPLDAVNALISEKNIHTARYAQQALTMPWSWDHSAALDFSRTPTGFDPESLFSVARRFHLLNDLENNQTGKLLEYVQTLKNDSEKFRQASALIVRQNHHITQKCDSTLRAALPLARNAEAQVRDFIQAESGHDKILLKALTALGTTPETIPALDVTIALMDVFEAVARRNLLGFAMIVDIFERTSYQEEDPMTSLLKAGGEDRAGRQMDIHRAINDSGGHENVALGFLAQMKSVDETYAREALFLAELVTLIIHQVSSETLKALRT